MENKKKVIAVVLIVAVILLLFSRCSLMPCEDCGDVPTRGYKNESSGKREFYCSDCSSECYLCDNDADKHYTGGIGIIFICNRCYNELKSYGWVD